MRRPRATSLRIDRARMSSRAGREAKLASCRQTRSAPLPRRARVRMPVVQACDGASAATSTPPAWRAVRLVWRRAMLANPSQFSVPQEVQSRREERRGFHGGATTGTAGRPICKNSDGRSGTRLSKTAHSASASATNSRPRATESRASNGTSVLESAFPSTIKM